MQTLNDARETAQRQLDAEAKKKSCKVCAHTGNVHGISHPSQEPLYPETAWGVHAQRSNSQEIAAVRAMNP